MLVLYLLTLVYRFFREVTFYVAYATFFSLLLLALLNRGVGYTDEQREKFISENLVVLSVVHFVIYIMIRLASYAVWRISVKRFTKARAEKKITRPEYSSRDRKSTSNDHSEEDTPPYELSGDTEDLRQHTSASINDEYGVDKEDKDVQEDSDTQSTSMD